MTTTLPRELELSSGTARYASISSPACPVILMVLAVSDSVIQEFLFVIDHAGLCAPGPSCQRPPPAFPLESSSCMSHDRGRLAALEALADESGSDRIDNHLPRRRHCSWLAQPENLGGPRRCEGGEEPAGGRSPYPVAERDAGSDRRRGGGARGQGFPASALAGAATGEGRRQPAARSATTPAAHLSW